jgi:hypothetical protein
VRGGRCHRRCRRSKRDTDREHERAFHSSPPDFAFNAPAGRRTLPSCPEGRRRNHPPGEKSPAGPCPPI